MLAKRVIKLLTIGGLALIIVALFLAWKAPATGYESSIYTATPLLVWVLLGFSAACGIGITIHQVWTKQHETSRLWVLGLLLILFSYVALLSLHIIRGYAFWCFGDPATHLGEINDIIGTGYFGGNNFYPVATTYAAQLCQICDLDPVIFLNLLPVVFAVLYVVFMYLLAKSLLPDKGAVIIVTVASLAPLHISLSFIPNGLANLLLPMALFLLVKSYGAGAWPWRGLVILMVFLFPVFHPVPAIALAAALAFMPVVKFIFDKIAKTTRKVFDSSVKFSLVALVILLIWGGWWVTSFPLAQGVMRSLAAESYSIPEATPAITEPTPVIEDASPRPEPYTLETAPAPGRTGGKVSNLARLIDAIRYAQAYGYSAAAHIFNIYGAVFLYIVLTLIALPILWRRIAKQPKLGNFVSLYGPLAAIALAIVALYFTAVGFSPLRFVMYIVLICTVFAGFMLYEIMGRARASHWNRARIIAPILVFLILAGVFGSGVSTLYASPLTLSDNYQVTRTEIDGVNWLLQNKDYSLDISAHCLPTRRFAYFLFTREERGQRQDILSRTAYSIPSHFGYHKGAWLGEYYDEDSYMVLGQRDRLRYVEVYPELAKYRFYPEDFERLEGDPTVNKLYSNGGLEVYYIIVR
jgi:hypothetical protein